MKKVRRKLETEEIDKIISKEVNFASGFSISFLHCPNGHDLYINKEYLGTLSMYPSGEVHI